MNQPPKTLINYPRKPELPPSQYRTTDPKPGTGDYCQGLKVLWYWNDGRKFKAWYTGNKRPPAMLFTQGPQFCDKYAYDRACKQMDGNLGKWSKVIIIDKNTDQMLEIHYMRNGKRYKKVYIRFEFIRVSSRDLTMKINLINAPQYIENHNPMQPNHK